MNLPRCLLLGLTLVSARALPPLEPGAALVSGKNDAEWRTLFSQLAPKGPILSHFTEERWFPFREHPIVLQGEMRLDPQHGLSLRYVQPEERILIVDARGILQRDARGRSRAVPPDPHVGSINAALLPVLRFDQAEITRNFTIQAVRNGAQWRLDFVPRDPALAKTLGNLAVFGTGVALERLEFRRAANQRIEIIIGETQPNAVFDAAALKHFFR